jgi:branched-chain amino acid transport system substrate-binding protein
MRKLSVIIACAAALALLATSALAGGVVKLGVNEIRSGAFKSNGDRFLWGIQAAVKEANDAGGVAGKKIELVVMDNQMKGEIAVRNVKRMILQDKVQAILHGSSSGVGGAIAQVMPRYKKIYLDLGAEALGITGKNFNPYVFRTCLNAGMHVKALAQYFAKKGYKKVFLINQDYSWGHDVAKYYEKFIKQLAPGTQIVGKEFHKVFNKDFGPYISKIQASGADYVISGNWGTDLTQLIVQSRSLGLKIPIGCCFLDDDAVGAVAGKATLGCVQANMYILGVDKPSAKAFEKRFHELSGGKWPSFVAMEAYIGTKMYLQAVAKAGTFDTAKVIKAFEGLQFQGPVGTITMRKQDHQNQTPVVIGEVKGMTKYYSFPYVSPVDIIPAAQVSLTLEQSGWKPYKGR